MSAFVIYAMCPDCMVMHGPFASDAQRGNFYATVHADKCVGVKQVPKEHRDRVGRKTTAQALPAAYSSTPPAPTRPAARSYAKGDASKPFPSGYSGSCYRCGFGYMEGDFIKMVTVADGEKGKAVHEDCADELLDSLWGRTTQNDDPPF